MKNIESLNRSEVIQSLRSYIDPKDFHRMILESTATLKGALQYHVEPDKTKPNIPQGPGNCACGLHWAHVGKHAPRNFVFAYSTEPAGKVVPVPKIEPITVNIIDHGQGHTIKPMQIAPGDSMNIIIEKTKVEVHPPRILLKLLVLSIGIIIGGIVTLLIVNPLVPI